MIIYTIQRMNSKLTWHEPKRQAALADRGLDFADANQIFASATFEYADTRENYGESRHIFSMRKANEREQSKFG